jgi:hypothetical protein
MTRIYLALVVVAIALQAYAGEHPNAAFAYVEPPSTPPGDPGSGIAAGTAGATFGLLDFLKDIHPPVHLPDIQTLKQE